MIGWRVRVHSSRACLMSGRSCSLARATANIGPLVELRFLELDVKDHSGLTLLL
jgi:hypothetical protein